MKTSTYLSALITGLMILSAPAWSFDDDFEISNVSLKPETFLDINAHSFRRSEEWAWQDTEQGWRITGGSISSNRLYLASDLRLKQSLSDHLSVALDWQQEEFYADKPLARPAISINVFPFSDSDWGFSVLGTTALDKRQADLGYAINYGRERDDFISLSWLKVDAFFNEKNEFDDASYLNNGETIRLKGVQKLRDNWRLQFDIEYDRPLSLNTDTSGGRFDYEGFDYSASIHYQLQQGGLLGSSVRYFDIDKSRAEAGGDQSQQLSYAAWDGYWVSIPKAEYELTLGMRYDAFEDNLTDQVDASLSYDFELSSWQSYASLHHSYSTHQSWDMGVYLGWSERDQIYRAPNMDTPDDERSDGIEAKFRGSWEYHSADKQTTLRLSFSLNLDDLFSDPGDGGGVHYVSRF